MGPVNERGHLGGLDATPSGGLEATPHKAFHLLHSLALDMDVDGCRAPGSEDHPPSIHPKTKGSNVHSMKPEFQGE